MDTNLILHIAGVETSNALKTTANAEEPVTVLKCSCADPGLSARLLGADSIQQTLVYQWLSFAATLSVDDGEDDSISTKLLALNNNLLSRAFLCGPEPTIADFAIFALMVTDKRIVDALSLEMHSAVFRFCSQMQHIALKNCNRDEIANAVGKRSFSQNRASLFPVVKVTEAAISVPQSISAAHAGQSKHATKAPESAATNNKIASDSNAKQAVDNSTPSLDPSKLDIRIGQVVKCWDHPESEKLLCEEIDLGEGKVRTIASGLRAFYSASEVQGRKVVVLANLKERPMAGFKSQGMVLCASNADHTNVKLLVPPEDAAIGDRVSFAGFSGEPATPAQVAKKKLLEQLAPQLRTNADGTACWGDIPFAVGASKVACTAPLSNAVVS